MAFGGFRQGDQGKPMAAINMVPLIDVMLVLLVIFIITAPLLTHAVKIDLPKAASQPNITKAESVQLGINAANVIFWNGEVVDMGELRRRMLLAAKLDQQPEVHIHADRTTQYQVLARVMAETSKAGLTRIGLVSHPDITR